MASNRAEGRGIGEISREQGLTKTHDGIEGLQQLTASFGAPTSYVDDGSVRRQVTDQSLSRILAVMTRYGGSCRTSRRN